MISLCTSQDGNEVSYEGYKRMPLGGEVIYPECVSGSARVTHFKIDGAIGQVVPAMMVSPGVTPILKNIVIGRD